MSSGNKVGLQEIDEEDVWPLAIARTGLSHTQIGAVCGVSADAVSKWDRRLSVPGYKAVRRFCWHFPHLMSLVIPVPEHTADVITVQFKERKKA